MKKDIFHSVFKRENLLLKGIYSFFYNIASYYRIMIEVFLRRKMGRRYFGVATAVTVAVLLAIAPILQYHASHRSRYLYGGEEQSSFLGMYATWYIFLVLFIAFADRRERETYPYSKVYDYKHFSLSSGNSLPLFYNLPFLKKQPSGYVIDVFLEPGSFFLIGLILLLAAQPIGLILIWASIAYSFSYAAAYKQQDDYFQDLIDAAIMNEETVRAFILGLDPDKSKGVNSNSWPSDAKTRRKMASEFAKYNHVQDIDFEVV